MNVLFVKAFEVWESDFRAHPEKYLTSAQVAALEVQSLSEQRAVCFVAILNALGQLLNTIGSPQAAAAVPEERVSRIVPRREPGVFSRSDCVWMYCPNRDECRQACAHPVRTA